MKGILDFRFQVNDLSSVPGKVIDGPDVSEETGGEQKGIC